MGGVNSSSSSSNGKINNDVSGDSTTQHDGALTLDTTVTDGFMHRFTNYKKRDGGKEQALTSPNAAVVTSSSKSSALADTATSLSGRISSKIVELDARISKDKDADPSLFKVCNESFAAVKNCYKENSDRENENQLACGVLVESLSACVSSISER